jgi:Sugar (and other) transporter
LISEIFPLKIRGQASSIATMANWLTNFVVSLTFLTLLKGLGDVTTFVLYSVLSLAGLFFCFRFVPETKGVPLEIIERNSQGPKGFGGGGQNRARARRSDHRAADSPEESAETRLAIPEKILSRY